MTSQNIRWALNHLVLAVAVAILMSTITLMVWGDPLNRVRTVTVLSAATYSLIISIIELVGIKLENVK